MPMTSLATKVPKGNISPSLTIEKNKFRLYWFNNVRHKKYTSLFDVKGRIIEKESEVDNYVTERDWEQYNSLRFNWLRDYVDLEFRMSIVPIEENLIICGIDSTNRKNLVMVLCNESSKVIEKVQKIVDVPSINGFPQASNISVIGQEALIAYLVQSWREESYHADLYIAKWNFSKDSITKSLVEADVYWGESTLGVVKNSVAVSYVGTGAGQSEIITSLFRLNTLTKYKDITTQRMR